MPTRQNHRTLAFVPETPAVGLRERKKLDTRRMLSDAALELAVEHGFDNVTREQIAARAGVSLRTFSNYFSGKYDALVYRQAERVKRGHEALRQRPADEPLWDAITEAIISPFAEEAAFADVPTAEQLAQLRKVAESADARAVVSKGIHEWIDVVAERTGLNPEKDMYPRLVVAVAAAVVESAMSVYVTADPPQHVTTFIRQGFSELRDGLLPPNDTETP